MVTTMRDKEVFLLAPGDQSADPSEEQLISQGFILVVEDDAPTLRLERVLLEEEGYVVEAVGSGEEAIKAVAAKKPALVLLDIGLPGMDGFTTCQRIRELTRAPIIMVTGLDCLDDKIKGMNVGADDYVTKPFLTHELATRVKVLLRRSALEAGGPLRRGRASQEPPQSPEKHSPATDVTPQISQEPPQSLNGATQASLPATEDGLAPQPEAAAPEPSASPADPAPVEPTDTNVFEGTVRLTVTALGPVRNLINFVSELRQNPRFRLLRLVANQHKEGMDIWLGLREPTPLLSTLTEIRGVHEVSTPDKPVSEGEEPVFTVLLD